MIQFYSPDITSTLLLDKEEASHCVRVLRKKAGDTVYVTDGRGMRYKCLIIEANPHRVRLEIKGEELIPKAWDISVTIAVAPTKNADRMAWLVEKATEIGVDRIIFLRCRHSERKGINIDRLRRVAVSAMNQSLKTILPVLEEGFSLEAILGLKGQRYFGYCDAETERKEFVKEYSGMNDIVIAIGPEGDFSSEEVEAMVKAGYMPVTFGQERLRTETAALYGLTAAKVLNTLKT